VAGCSNLFSSPVGFRRDKISRLDPVTAYAYILLVKKLCTLALAFKDESYLAFKVQKPLEVAT